MNPTLDILADSACPTGDSEEIKTGKVDYC
jgi:hypothetical protein